MTVLDKNTGLNFEKIGLSAVFLVIGALTLLDIAEDYFDGASLTHLSIELFIAIACLAGFYFVIRDFKEKVTSLSSDLETQRDEIRKWKNRSEKYVKGLSSEIDSRFQNWGFTEIEKEIGFLLLKGLSFKEVADIRDKKERTVRQQALAMYRKSGLQGRAEFSAFFLEDLLPPVTTFGQRTGDSLSSGQSL